MRHPVDTEEVLKTCPVYTRKKWSLWRRLGRLIRNITLRAFARRLLLIGLQQKQWKVEFDYCIFRSLFSCSRTQVQLKHKVKKGFADDHTILSSNCMDYQAVLTHIMITVRIYAYAFIHKYFSITTDGKKIKVKISLHVGGDMIRNIVDNITSFLVGHSQMARKSLEGKHFIAFLLIL